MRGTPNTERCSLTDFQQQRQKGPGFTSQTKETLPGNISPLLCNFPTLFPFQILFPPPGMWHFEEFQPLQASPRILPPAGFAGCSRQHGLRTYNENFHFPVAPAAGSCCLLFALRGGNLFLMPPNSPCNPKRNLPGRNPKETEQGKLIAAASGWEGERAGWYQAHELKSSQRMRTQRVKISLFCLLRIPLW